MIINNEISIFFNIIKETFFASLVCMLIPTLIVNYQIKGKILIKEVVEVDMNYNSNSFERNLIFFIGIFWNYFCDSPAR